MIYSSIDTQVIAKSVVLEGIGVGEFDESSQDTETTVALVERTAAR